MDHSFWRGKRVLVTGHTGFKGGWISLWLSRLEAQVTGFSLPPPSNPNLYNVAKVGSRIDSVIGDIRDAEAIAAAVVRSRPEIVFHMAAQPIVRRSYRDPIETYSTNVMGTVHVLDAVRRIGDVRV